MGPRTRVIPQAAMSPTAMTPQQTIQPATKARQFPCAQCGAKLEFAPGTEVHIGRDPVNDVVYLMKMTSELYKLERKG